MTTITNLKTSPWVRGIVDTLVGAALIRNSAIPTRNRLVVILVDTAFETACRAFLKYHLRIKLDQNHAHRETLVKTVKAKLQDIDQEVWDNIDYYYTEIRCDFYHQSAGKTLTDTDLLDYQETVEFVIDRAFGISIGDLVRAAQEALPEGSTTPQTDIPEGVSIHQVDDDRDKVLVAVAFTSPESVEEINAYFKREGEKLRLKPKDLTGILARNSGTKRYFFYNRKTRRWELSGLGKFRLKQLVKGENANE